MSGMSGKQMAQGGPVNTVGEVGALKQNWLFFALTIFATFGLA